MILNTKKQHLRFFLVIIILKGHKNIIVFFFCEYTHYYLLFIILISNFDNIILFDLTNILKWSVIFWELYQRDSTSTVLVDLYY
jgi:hypothetical protein